MKDSINAVVMSPTEKYRRDESALDENRKKSNNPE